MTGVTKRSLYRTAVRGLATGVFAAAVALPLSFAAPATAQTVDRNDDMLTAGEILKPRQSVKSSNGQYKLIQQVAGNLVLYGPGNQALWSTPTSGTLAYTTMQKEGNLVVYSATNKPLWTTKTAGNPGAYLKVQNDGNLVVYSADGKPLWSRHAYIGSLPSGHTLKAGQWVQSKNGRYKLFMQKEGNLVLYGPGHQAKWTTPTANHPGAKATMQKEGNLVIYSADDKPLWTTKTAGNPGAYLAVQDAGNVVIYSEDNKPLWQAK
ncbi:curculin domain-containing protein [Thermostaphylospora chromogena]|uniref:D-mannose binding lectin n=1 Tax=Thermostaphylospora chromogena TaxID=35622 RepID=A0A1H1BZ85_9ACTN|nr:curculin domain-containing protein [Thermostaphylospora chromogena]SDQ57287.1 D-mannose binding lectin [Thermostaphylospora chromogena]